MDVLDAIHQRRSIRDYKDEAVPQAQIERLIEAAIQAPSAVNQQPWIFTIVRDKALLDRSPRLVSFTHMSNVLGTINPAAEMIRMAHAAGAITLVDGAQSAGHCPVDVQAIGCDFFAFSGHKICGPTGIGALCWLPDIAGWAHTVAAMLRPGGFLFIREAHPVTWSMTDPRPDGLLVVEYPYFEHPGLAFVEPSTYVEHDGELAAPVQVVFNHGLAEIFNALWSAGLHIELFEEHRSLPWNPLGDAMADIGGGEYALRTGVDRLPLSYTLRAVRQ